MKPYELVDHTADIGIRAWGQTREALFANMALGMTSLIVSPDQIRVQETVSVSAQAEDWETTLVAWLKELLFLFESRRFLSKSFQIQRLEPTAVEASVSGELLDLNRHPVEHEVKAVTYCDLQITQTPEGLWSAQVIFDI